jgi:hypothetical protein
MFNKDIIDARSGVTSPTSSIRGYTNIHVNSGEG